MKNIISGLILIALVSLTFACKSGKSGCDAYGKVETKKASSQVSK